VRLYISGPITGHDDYRNRFAAAERWAVSVGGVETVNPLDVTACPDGSCEDWPANPRQPNGHTWACLLRYDLIAMLACDGVVTLPGWERSRGAVLEVTTALAVGLTVTHMTEADVHTGLVLVDSGVS
jgi:hypothetical protein